MKKKSDSYLQTILSFIALGVAIYAVIISQITLDNSNSQFEQNIRSSDSLFNYQLKHSKELNDSLIYQISELQKITNNQLKITDEQLQISIQTLQEEIYSRRPKIIVEKNEIKDTNIITGNEFINPEIFTYFNNIGKRPAKNFLIRAFILFSDFSSYIPAEKQENEIIDPEQSFIFIFNPKIPFVYKDDFYYIFEIIYKDDELKRKFSQAYYYHYNKPRKEFGFYYCNVDESEKVRMNLNRLLKYFGRELFDN